MSIEHPEAISCENQEVTVMMIVIIIIIISLARIRLRWHKHVTNAFPADLTYWHI